MLQTIALLAHEPVVGIRELQKNPSRHLKGVKRISRSGKTIGFFIAEKEMQDILEEMTAELTPKFKKMLRQSQQEFREGKFISLAALKKKYGL